MLSKNLIQKRLLSTVAMTMIAAFGLSSCGNATDKTKIQKIESEAAAAASANVIATEANKKIETLTALMARAKSKNIDVTREETVIWFSKEFLKFANWDESHPNSVEYMFEQYGPYRGQGADYASMLPDFQRTKVNIILDEAIETLTAEIDGRIKRRPVAKVDWENIDVKEDMLVSNGKPVFLYDYFSKSVGRPLTDTDVYNDHLGAIYHGGQRLYDVNKDRAVNSYLLNEDGTFDQERLSYVTEIPDTNVGFLILWNMGIPDWILKKEPEADKGRSLFTGYDIDNPLVRDVWGKIIRKTGELTKGKKVTQLGYILSNEPHWYSEKGHWSHQFKEMNSISSYTEAKFEAWLDEKYEGDIERLNKNWKTSFADFDAVKIDIPIDRKLRGTPIWYDWCRYNMDRSIDWFTYLQGELRETNPEADTHIKIMPNMFTENSRSHGIDVEALTELTSMIGDDAKTRSSRHLNYKKAEEWEEKYAYFWEEMSVAYDFMESVSPNKIHVNSETHFLSASWSRELDMSADYVRSVFWLATIQGMDAAISWFWARDPDGSPEDRLEGEMDFFDPALAGSFAGSVNQQPHIANAKTQVMMDMNSFSEEIMALRKQRRPVRLFHSETSAINKKFHMTEQFKLYESLFFEGFPLGYATQNIIEKQDNSQWDTVLVYKTPFVTDAEFASLQSYLNAGGTVIVDGENSLSFDEYGTKRSTKLAANSGRLVTLKNGTIEEMRDIALRETKSTRADLLMTENNGTSHKGTVWRAVQTGEGRYLVNALNIGKNATELSFKVKNSKPQTVKNLMTGEALEAELKLPQNGVLLLEITY